MTSNDKSPNSTRVVTSYSQKSAGSGKRSESQIQADIIEALSNGPTRLWRTNAGMGWTGRMVSNVRGNVTLSAARVLHAMPMGWPDLTGFTVVDGVAVFLAIEVKDATGRIRPEQREFLAFLRSMGCRAGVARSVEEARMIVAGVV